MRKRLLVAFAVTAVAATSWAIWVEACDQDKQASANGKTSVTAVTASTKGECAGHSATAGTTGCPYHQMDAATASHEGCASKTSAATASHEGCASKANATTASHEGCAMKSSATASMAGGCCAKNGGITSSAAYNRQACALGAGMIGAPGCGSDFVTASAGVRDGCDACAQMVTCTNEMMANGVQTQIVPLKNGVMFVYTTDTPAHVRAVQNALARRSDRLQVLTQAGDKAKLCPECKNARGAIASGKLTRETVNIEGGCMTLVTSTDPMLVAKLRSLANTSNSRNKS